MIDGRTLREDLHKYPIGTLFRCIGHWDRGNYYKVGGIYRFDKNPDFPDQNDLVLITPAQSSSGHRRGNGYSGKWELLKVDKLLEALS